MVSCDVLCYVMLCYLMWWLRYLMRYDCLCCVMLRNILQCYANELLSVIPRNRMECYELKKPLVKRLYRGI